MITIFQSLTNLEEWVQSNGWDGYDPYDIKGTKLCLFFGKYRYTRIIMNRLMKRCSIFCRKLFGVKREINAKAMALFARAYLNIYRTNREQQYLEKAKCCLNWLVENPSENYSGLCWGYPFQWQTRLFMPKGTPSGVVTSIAAHAFLDAYEQLKDDEYLEIAKSCCEFITKDLNQDHVAEDQLCFSYTPIDDFHVHNSNLLCASVLLRTYRHSGNKMFKELGIKAIKYTMNHQREDGSWYYWAPPNKLIYNIDNYHTGFVLESLNICRSVLGKEFGYEEQSRKGLKFYVNNLFLSDGAPKIRHNEIYPIDIHSCSQGVITFCELADFAPEYYFYAKKIAQWTIENMQDKKDGHFYYRKYKKWTDKTPYIRWGQAWMLRALSYLV